MLGSRNAGTPEPSPVRRELDDNRSRLRWRRARPTDGVFLAAQRAMSRRGPLELTLADIAAEARAVVAAWDAL